MRILFEYNKNQAVAPRDLTGYNQLNMDWLIGARSSSIVPSLVEIVNNNPTIREDELKLIFEKFLDAHSQVWLVGIGLVIGLFSSITILLITSAFQTNVVAYAATLVVFEIVLILTLRTFFQGVLSKKFENSLKDYLLAKKILGCANSSGSVQQQAGP